MSIGSTIKSLRRAKNLTQEDLAEYLGITSKAVSQWECDRTAPDLSQLPALCHIFDVTSDELLGIDIAKTNEAIARYLEQAKEEEYQGNFENSVDILREANRLFPRSHKIMEQLANALVCVYSRKGIREYDEVFALCRRVLDECTDSVTRYRATDTLATAYGYAGKKEEMRELAQEMPRSHFSYENFMLYHWNGDADLKDRLGYISYLINQLISSIGVLAGHRHDNDQMVYDREDRIALHKLQVELLELLFPDGDYQYVAQDGEIACSNLLTIYLRMNDPEQAWHWLEKGADFAIQADTYDENADHTSPILRGYSDGGWIMEANGNRSQSMLDWLTTDSEAEVFHTNARYEELICRLRKVAKKP